MSKSRTSDLFNKDDSGSDDYDDPEPNQRGNVRRRPGSGMTNKGKKRTGKSRTSKKKVVIPKDLVSKIRKAGTGVKVMTKAFEVVTSIREQKEFKEFLEKLKGISMHNVNAMVLKPEVKIAVALRAVERIFASAQMSSVEQAKLVALAISAAIHFQGIKKSGITDLENGEGPQVKLRSLEEGDLKIMVLKLILEQMEDEITSFGFNADRVNAGFLVLAYSGNVRSTLTDLALNEGSVNTILAVSEQVLPGLEVMRRGFERLFGDLVGDDKTDPMYNYSDGVVGRGYGNMRRIFYKLRDELRDPSGVFALFVAGRLEMCVEKDALDVMFSGLSDDGGDGDICKKEISLALTAARAVVMFDFAFRTCTMGPSFRSVKDSKPVTFSSLARYAMTMLDFIEEGSEDEGLMEFGFGSTKICAFDPDYEDETTENGAMNEGVRESIFRTWLRIWCRCHWDMSRGSREFGDYVHNGAIILETGSTDLSEGLGADTMTQVIEASTTTVGNTSGLQAVTTSSRSRSSIPERVEVSKKKKKKR
jgi:hypothetical protein